MIGASGLDEPICYEKHVTTDDLISFKPPSKHQYTNKISITFCTRFIYLYIYREIVWTVWVEPENKIFKFCVNFIYNQFSCIILSQWMLKRWRNRQWIKTLEFMKKTSERSDEKNDLENSDIHDTRKCQLEYQL